MNPFGGNSVVLIRIMGFLGIIQVRSVQQLKWTMRLKKSKTFELGAFGGSEL